MIQSFFGFMGAFLCATCGLPEVWKTVKSTYCRVGWGFLLTWLFGEIFLVIYLTYAWDWYLFGNYALNLLCICVLIYFKLKTDMEDL